MEVFAGRGADLCGNESLFLPALALGAAGGCNAISSVLPGRMLAIWQAAEAGDMPAAYRRLLPVMRFFQCEGVCRSTKATAALTGQSYGGHQAPLLPIPEAPRRELAGLLEADELFG